MYDLAHKPVETFKAGSAASAWVRPKQQSVARGHLNGPVPKSVPRRSTPVGLPLPHGAPLSTAPPLGLADRTDLGYAATGTDTFTLRGKVSTVIASCGRSLDRCGWSSGEILGQTSSSPEWVSYTKVVLGLRTVADIAAVPISRGRVRVTDYVIRDSLPRRNRNSYLSGTPHAVRITFRFSDGAAAIYTNGESVAFTVSARRVVKRLVRIFDQPGYAHFFTASSGGEDSADLTVYYRSGGQARLSVYPSDYFVRPGAFTGFKPHFLATGAWRALSSLRHTTCSRPGRCVQNL